MHCPEAVLILQCTLIAIVSSSEDGISRPFTNENGRSIHVTFERSASQCNNTLTTLTNTCDYTILNNITLQYTPLNTNLSIVSYSTEGLPIVCLYLPMQPASFLMQGFSPLALSLYQTATVLVLCTSLAVLLLAVAYIANSRTISSFLTINLALSLAIGDITLIFNAFGHGIDTLCILSAMAEHFFLLTEFSWLALLGGNFALRFYRIANSLPPKLNSFIMLLYLCIGWGPSFLFTGVAVVIYSLPGAEWVIYGQSGFCHLAPSPAVVLLLITPIIAGWIVAMAALLWILLYLYKIPFHFDTSDKKRFAFILGFLVVMAADIVMTMWVLLDRSPPTHVTSLFVYIFVLFARSLLLATGFIPKRQLIKKLKSILRNKVSPTSYIEPHPHLCPGIDPLDAAELVNMMSDPSLVPKIYTCARQLISQQ